MSSVPFTPRLSIYMLRNIRRKVSAPFLTVQAVANPLRDPEGNTCALIAEPLCQDSNTTPDYAQIK